MKLTVEQIARLCHETNRAFCEIIGDTSQVPWNEAPDWQKSSAINAVNFIINTPDAKASCIHDSWMKEKLDNGWKFGPIKDASKREHPCLVPFEELPPEQRVKDVLVKAVIDSAKCMLV